MKKLTFKIDRVKNTVTFTFIHNTISHSETSTLISEVTTLNSLEEFYQNLVDKSVRMELDLRKVNSGNEISYLENFIFYNEEDLPLVSIKKDEGRFFSDFKKTSLLAEIKNSIIEQKEFTSITLFEMRVNDLDFVDFEINDRKRIYNYQVFQKSYQRV